MVFNVHYSPLTGEILEYQEGPNVHTDGDIPSGMKLASFSFIPKGTFDTFSGRLSSVKIDIDKKSPTVGQIVEKNPAPLPEKLV